MLAMPFDEVGSADVESLIRDRAEETQRLEFKRELDLTKGADKKEFAKDVSGMANAAGGRILYGIDEGTSGGGRPVAEKIVPLTDRTLVDRANNILSDAITPPVRARIRPIEVEGRFVMMIEVPPSDYQLHMVGAYGDSRYYMRTEKSVVPMPEVEVRRAYERIIQLRHDREARVRKVVETEVAQAGVRLNTLMIPLTPAAPDFDVIPFNEVGPWLYGPHKIAQVNIIQDILYQLRPTGGGIEAQAPNGVPIDQARVVLRLLRDGTLHVGSPIESIMSSECRLNEIRLLYDVFNACAWTEIICRRATIRGPVRAVVVIPSSERDLPAGTPDVIVDMPVLKKHKEPIIIEHEWVPSQDVADRLKVLQAIFDRLWQHMGRTRCDLFFTGPGRLQSRIERLLGLVS